MYNRRKTFYPASTLLDADKKEKNYEECRHQDASMGGKFQQIHNRHIKNISIANRQIRADIRLDQWLEGTQ